MSSGIAVNDTQLLALMASIIWAAHYAKKADPALDVGLETCVDDAEGLLWIIQSRANR